MMALRCSMRPRRRLHWTWLIVASPVVGLACLIALRLVFG